MIAKMIYLVILMKKVGDSDSGPRTEGLQLFTEQENLMARLRADNEERNDQYTVRGPRYVSY